MKRNTVELKERLIQTGVKEIRERGIGQLSVRRIATVCGVSHGSPYKHFGSKDGYLQVLMIRLSEEYYQRIVAAVHSGDSAREQILQMGVQFVIFAREESNLFEALFIKYPFNYIEVMTNSIEVTADLPGFVQFKKTIQNLREEENLLSSEAELLIQFWSFITGLAVLVRSPLGENFDNDTIRSNISTMLEIYLKGVKQ